MKIDPTRTPSALLPATDRLLNLAAAKIRDLDRTWDAGRGTPVFTQEGRYTTRGWTEWTQGFQYGCAILQYDMSGEEEFLDIGRGALRLQRAEWLQPGQTRVRGRWPQEVTFTEQKRGRIDLTDGVHTVADRPNRIGAARSAHGPRDHLSVHRQRHRSRCPPLDATREPIPAGRRSRSFDCSIERNVIEQVQPQDGGWSVGPSDVRACGREQVLIQPYEALSHHRSGVRSGSETRQRDRLDDREQVCRLGDRLGVDDAGRETRKDEEHRGDRPTEQGLVSHDSCVRLVTGSCSPALGLLPPAVV